MLYGMNSINSQIAAKVRAGLAEQRITNEEYFLAVGFSDRTGARRLSGCSRWTSDELDLTARFLGLSLSELVASVPQAKAAGTVLQHLTDVDAHLLEAVRADGRFSPEEVDVDVLRGIVFTELADGWQAKREVTAAAITLSLVSA